MELGAEPPRIKRCRVPHVAHVVVVIFSLKLIILFFSDMHTKRDRAGATVFGGRIYVFGGSYGNVAVTSVECYDPREDGWSVITELPYPRYGFRCATTAVTNDMIADVPPAKPKARKQEKLI